MAQEMKRVRGEQAEPKAEPKAHEAPKVVAEVAEPAKAEPVKAEPKAEWQAQPIVVTMRTCTLKSCTFRAPEKYYAGQITTGNAARNLNIWTNRQFQSNENAADDALIAAGKPPMTAEEHLSRWAGYIYSPNETTSEEALETLRQRAGRMALIRLFTEHNEIVGRGEVSSLLSKTAGSEVQEYRAGKDKDSVQWRKEMVEGMLAMPRYTARIQYELNLLLAEKGKGKAKGKAKAKVAGPKVVASALLSDD